MPDPNSGTFKFREIEPGRVELSLSIDGKPFLLPVTHQGAWNAAKDLMQFLNRWPPEVRAKGGG